MENFVDCEALPSVGYWYVSLAASSTELSRARAWPHAADVAGCLSHVLRKHIATPERFTWCTDKFQKNVGEGR